jgi:hypothetical protein
MEVCSEEFIEGLDTLRTGRCLEEILETVGRIGGQHQGGAKGNEK